MHTHYVDDDMGRGSDPVPLTVDDEWQLGVAFGKRDERLRLGFLSWDRVGFALTLDSQKNLSGFRLVFNRSTIAEYDRFARRNPLANSPHRRRRRARLEIT